jgi:hypothetical protein
MKATRQSTRPYFPMLLANGCDAVLTDDHVLVEHYRVLEVPAKEVGIAFVVDRPHSGLVAADLTRPCRPNFAPAAGCEVAFTYRHHGLDGAGAMLVRPPPDATATFPEGLGLRCQRVAAGTLLAVAFRGKAGPVARRPGAVPGDPGLGPGTLPGGGGRRSGFATPHGGH